MPPDGLDEDQAASRALLGTSVLDYRRIAGQVTDEANANRLGLEIDPLFGFLNGESCAAVSVDDIHVASFNEAIPVIPASTQKILIAAVALEVLGPEFRFTTTVRTPIPNDGVVTGDVYLVGGGDPLLTSDDYPIDDDALPAFATTSLDQLADAFVASGIRRINGTVIGDGTRYDNEWVVDGWGDGVAFVSAGPVDALLVNDSRVLGRGGIEEDPNAAAARELARLLGNRNVTISNGWGSGQASTLTTVIGSVESAPLSEIVREMLTNSDNNTAEMLLKELGVAEGASGTRVGGPWCGRSHASFLGHPDGRRAARRRLRSRPGEPPDVCGPAAGARSAVAVPLWRQGSPSPARPAHCATSSSDSPMAGRLFAKTGTLGNPPADAPPPAVKALAGYVPSDDRGTIEFVMIVNAAEIPDADYQSLWAVFGDRFATYPAIPDPFQFAPT